MADIFPLRGLRYNKKLIPNLSQVITPPYDVITPEAQEAYYKAHPYNVIRLDFGKILTGDQATDNRYTRAARLFSCWQKKEILLPEAEPALYLFQQKFNFQGKEKIRTNLIARVKLVPYEKGIILPHEETFSKVKADRLALLESCRANFSPIFGLYSEPEQKINEILNTYAFTSLPETSFKDEEGVLYSLWVITEREIIRTLQAQMASLPIYIADGHHRYETALEFCSLHQGKYDSILMALVNLYDPGLVILPTHRLVKASPWEGLKFSPRVNDLFELSPREFFELTQGLPQKQAAVSQILKSLKEKGSRAKTLAFYAGGPTVFFLTLKNSGLEILKQLPLRLQLDVSLLHSFLLKEIKGEKFDFTYTPHALEAITKVQAGEAHFAVLLNPLLPEEMVAVSRQGEKMPPKSTYFYPKLPTGLVINKLES